MTSSSVPQGWYPDPQGEQGALRWWDGEAWTDHTTPDPRASQQAQQAEAEASAEQASQAVPHDAGESAPEQSTAVSSEPTPRRSRKKFIVIGLIALVAVGLIAAAAIMLQPEEPPTGAAAVTIDPAIIEITQATLESCKSAAPDGTYTKCDSTALTALQPALQSTLAKCGQGDGLCIDITGPNAYLITGMTPAGRKVTMIGRREDGSKVPPTP